MHLLWFLLIGIAAGWLAGQFMKGGGYGLIGDLVIGVIGAFIGGWLLGAFGIYAGGLIGSLVTATIGAIVLLYLVRLLEEGVEPPYAATGLPASYTKCLWRIGPLGS